MEIKLVERNLAIPDNRIAKLMYYLDCLVNIIDLDDGTVNLDRLTDYEHYYNLTEEEQKTVAGLCIVSNPEALEQFSLLLVKPELLPNGSGNEFFDIKDPRLGVEVPEAVTFAETPVKVLKVMVCTEEWIDKYYTQPAQSFIEEEQAKAQNKGANVNNNMPPNPNQNYMPPNPNQVYMPPNPNQNYMPPNPNQVYMPPNPNQVYIPPNPDHPELQPVVFIPPTQEQIKKTREIYDAVQVTHNLNLWERRRREIIATAIVIVIVVIVSACTA